MTKVNDVKHTIEYASKKQSLLILGNPKYSLKEAHDYLVVFIYLVSRWHATKQTPNNSDEQQIYNNTSHLWSNLNGDYTFS